MEPISTDSTDEDNTKFFAWIDINYGTLLFPRNSY